MKVVTAKYEILSDISQIVNAPKTIETAARTCYKSEENTTDDSAEKFCRRLIRLGHTAMLEHAPTISVKFTVDRGITHELVRHRLSSFAQESTRYCNYSKGKFESSIAVVDLATGFKYDMMNETDYRKYYVWYNAMLSAERSYLELLELGATPQEARSVLPTSTKAELIVTANVREWRTILSLRGDKTAHPQVREVVVPLTKELATLAPCLFDDLGV